MQWIVLRLASRARGLEMHKDGAPCKRKREPSGDTPTTRFGAPFVGKDGESKGLFFGQEVRLLAPPTGGRAPSGSRRRLPKSEQGQQARDLRRLPFAITARRRNAAFVQRRCDGPQARYAARP